MGKYSKILIIGLLAILVAALVFFIFPSDVKKREEVKKGNDLSQKQAVKYQVDSEGNARDTASSQPTTSVRQHGDSEMEIQELMDEINAYYENPEAVDLDSIVPYLDHADNQVVSNTFDLLYFIAKKGYQKKEVFNLLASRASDSTYKMRSMAIIKGAMLGGQDMLPIVASFIEEQNINSDPQSQENGYVTASRALSSMASQDAIPFIKDLLENIEEPGTRFTNYQTLAALKSPEATALLLELAESSQGQDQIHSVLALARTESEEASTFLTQAIENNKLSRETIARLAASPQASDIFGENLNAPEATDKIKLQLLNKLAKFSPKGNYASREKMATLMVGFIDKNESLELKVKAMHVIDELGAKTTIEIIKPFFDDKEAELRRKAVNIFSSYTNASNYKALENSLWDSDQKTRRVAIAAMGRYLGKDDIALLKKVSAHDDKYIQQYANEILQQLEMTE